MLLMELGIWRGLVEGRRERENGNCEKGEM
jgi:hypothetical protein